MKIQGAVEINILWEHSILHRENFPFSLKGAGVLKSNCTILLSQGEPTSALAGILACPVLSPLCGIPACIRRLQEQTAPASSFHLARKSSHPPYSLLSPGPLLSVTPDKHLSSHIDQSWYVQNITKKHMSLLLCYYLQVISSHSKYSLWICGHDTQENNLLIKLPINLLIQNT